MRDFGAWPRYRGICRRCGEGSGRVRYAGVRRWGRGRRARSAFCGVDHGIGHGRDHRAVCAQHRQRPGADVARERVAGARHLLESTDLAAGTDTSLRRRLHAPIGVSRSPAGGRSAGRRTLAANDRAIVSCGIRPRIASHGPTRHRPQTVRRKCGPVREADRAGGTLSAHCIGPRTGAGRDFHYKEACWGRSPLHSNTDAGWILRGLENSCPGVGVAGVAKKSVRCTAIGVTGRTR